MKVEIVPDPHSPNLSSFSLSPEESIALSAALATEDSWNHDALELSEHKLHLKNIKVRLASLHMERQDGKCCYCRKQIGEHGPFFRDREHILPKGKFKKLTWVLYNLSVACKRCNMSVKGRKTDFVVDLTTIENHATDPAQYRFVHPNFERWEDHLTHVHAQVHPITLVYYAPKHGSKKGEFTFNFFKLRELMVGNFDSAQHTSPKESESIHLIKALAEKFEQ